MIDERTDLLSKRFSLLKNELHRIHKRLVRKREKQGEELAETHKALWYRQIGDSLMALRQAPARGASSITIRNIHTEKDETVPINPKFNHLDNAKLLYKKAKKADRGNEINEKKVEETDADIVRCAELSAACGDCKADASADDLEALLKTIETFLDPHLPHRTGPAVSPHKPEEKVPYRCYEFDGWYIYIGKNDAQNDELTTRFAKHSDLWLHVAGHAGSHVVIKRPDRTSQVPQEIISKAASLAVWFSKAKHTTYAEVHVTEARFVRKRRHSPPGEVVAERCKSVRVSPRSPHDFFPAKYSENEE